MLEWHTRPDERVAEEHAQRTVGGDRRRLDHQDHARLEHVVGVLTLDAVCEDVRTRSYQVDAVQVDGARLRTMLAEEATGGARVLQRAVRSDGIHHALETGQNDLVEEAAHFCRRFADAHR